MNKRASVFVSFVLVLFALLTRVGHSQGCGSMQLPTFSLPTLSLPAVSLPNVSLTLIQPQMVSLPAISLSNFTPATISPAIISPTLISPAQISPTLIIIGSRVSKLDLEELRFDDVHIPNPDNRPDAKSASVIAMQEFARFGLDGPMRSALEAELVAKGAHLVEPENPIVRAMEYGPVFSVDDSPFLQS